MSTLGDIMMSTSGFSIEIERLMKLLPHMHHDIPLMY